MAGWIPGHQVPELGFAELAAVLTRVPSPPPLDRGQYTGSQIATNQLSVTGFRCPFCQSTHPPQVKSKISTAGWVMFVVLLIACFPLCVVALFIKEDYRVCSSCGTKLG